MTDMAFSAGALDANRAGRLGPDQLRDLQASVRYRRSGRTRTAGDARWGKLVLAPPHLAYPMVSR
ncbi:MAG: hypothetical protein ACLQER_24650 [Streptosporangiaceae bacterium]